MSTLKGSDKLIAGVCCIAAALNFVINLWHAEEKSVSEPVEQSEGSRRTAGCHRVCSVRAEREQHRPDLLFVR